MQEKLLRGMALTECQQEVPQKEFVQDANQANVIVLSNPVALLKCRIQLFAGSDVHLLSTLALPETLRLFPLELGQWKLDRLLVVAAAGRTHDPSPDLPCLDSESNPAGSTVTQIIDRLSTKQLKESDKTTYPPRCEDFLGWLLFHGFLPRQARGSLRLQQDRG